jgi:hypothetical protein
MILAILGAVGEIIKREEIKRVPLGRKRRENLSIFHKLQVPIGRGEGDVSIFEAEVVILAADGESQQSDGNAPGCRETMPTHFPYYCISWE